jgi:Leucine-rich repeat (LRR) protein
MGNTQPSNKTGKKVVSQKLEHATKTGVLSLCEHKLEALPNKLWEMTKLRTLDLSKNALIALNPNISSLTLLKNLNLEQNQLQALTPSLSKLTNLQTLNFGGNPMLGKALVVQEEELPTSLKQIKGHSINLYSIPKSLFSLQNLDKLDLSHNKIGVLPPEIQLLSKLSELNLDHNSIQSLPTEIGKLTKLKVLSLKSNRLSVNSQPHPLPQSLFEDTPVIDLNLHGNPLTSTQLNEMEGYESFLERRQKVKTSALLGGALTNFDVCGLK